MSKKLNKKQQALYNELKKEAKKANQRLLELERKFGKDAWASKNLRKRLEAEKVQAFTKTGRISTSKSMNMQQMRAVLNATEKFLNSKTSTLRGIKETRLNVISSMQKTMSLEDNDVSYDDAELIYRIWGDKDIKIITKEVRNSDFINLIQDMREQAKNEDDVMNILSRYIHEPSSDKELVKEVEKLYNRYIKR